jgi:preprotein translocase subunit Sec61beta
MLKNPTNIPRYYDETNAQLIRRDPESYVYFCVGLLVLPADVVELQGK